MKKIAFLALVVCILTCTRASVWLLDTIPFTTNVTSTVLDGRFNPPVKLTGILLSPPVSVATNTTYVKIGRPGIGYDIYLPTVEYTNEAYRITGLDLILAEGQTIWISNTFSTGKAILEFQME